MIYAIGDSNMFPACTELISKPKENNLVSVFSNLANNPFRCWAKNGASNHWITTHIDYFRDCATEDDFLLVGWTSWEREEWPWIHENISVCNGPNFGVPNALQGKFLKWKTQWNDQTLHLKKQYWHNQIYQIHCDLLKSNIRHLFWLTYDSFSDLDPYSWNKHFFKPYDYNGCMYHYLKSKNHGTLKNDDYHFGPQAHQEWAETLFHYTKEHNL